MRGYDCDDALAVTRPYTARINASMARRSQRRRDLWAKRMFDIVFAVCGLVVLLPILVGVAVIVRIALGSPVLYRQCRPGLYARPFVLLKFRTMLPKEAREGRKLTHDERRTRTGMVLRRLGLDELPQLVNVLKGEMSIVGPRPVLVEYLPECTPGELRRHEVRPGLTGLAQVHGRQELPWEERFKLDVWYVDHWSLRLDAQVIVDTPFSMLRSRGDVGTLEEHFVFKRSATLSEVPQTPGLGVGSAHGRKGGIGGHQADRAGSRVTEVPGDGSVPHKQRSRGASAVIHSDPHPDAQVGVRETGRP